MRVNFKTDLIDYLEAFSGLSALVSDRIYSIRAPQAGQTYPYIVFFVISDDRQQFQDGPCSYFEPRVQFDIFSDSLNESEQVADQLELAMNALSGVNGSTNFAYAHLEQRRDDFTEDVDSYRISADYQFMIKST